MIEMLERPAVRRRVLPFSVERYHRLRDSGVVPVRTELLNGVIVEKMTKSPRHTLLAHRLLDRLAVDLPPGYQLRKEDPLTLATSEPEPDLAIVLGDMETYRDRHPTRAELTVEIAVSNVEVDRAKADLYAGAGVSVYWLVIANAGAVEVYTQPRADGYRSMETKRSGQALETWYGTRIPLATLFA
ncbi:Uma2 family endonuclease [Candidatus Thiosymbion oneisti]|uniref:Uma2 family endonuclease n=1 Tax=Candidatus Thiosymbion oneisti TaxID=589554 RepID=UPI001061361A|nr:Uma2 family endonuclease [Candidatus Thiosymbion oneisti]